MLTIIGNGMNPYNLKYIDIDFNDFDMIICDKNFIGETKNLYKLGFKEAKEKIITNAKTKNLLYIVTGSPLFYSGATLMLNYAKKESIPFKVIDNTSSKSYMLSLLGISENETESFSLHGRSQIDLSKLLNSKYSFILCDEFSIDRLKEALKYLNKNDYKITIGSKFGYEDETIKEIELEKIQNSKEYMPYVLLIERNYEPLNIISKDEEFSKDNGMLTKEYKRHLSLSLLDLKPNLTLWDIGAGSGSISIDAFKRYRVKTLLFEKNEKRANDIKENLSKHKVIDSTLIIGNAEDEIKKVKNSPDRIFIGGGGEKLIDELPFLYEKLNENGVIVANFVTLAHLTKTIEILKAKKIEFDIKSFSLTTYKSSLLISEPERLMFQIKVVK